MIGIEGALVVEVGEGLAGHELENQVQVARGFLEPVYRTDARMVERSQDLGLALKPNK